MWHELVGGESAFFASLIECDEKLAASIRERGCPCGGRLDRADYPRKPRGVPAAWDEAWSRRISLCCAAQGCRKRSTPPSVRFFGRRVYVAAVIVLVCGRWVTARRAKVPKDTARRWRRYFSTAFVASAFWRGARAALMPPVDESDLVAALLSRLDAGRAVALVQVLRFFCPVTTRCSRRAMSG
jgi:hypothetical protein